MLTALSTTWLPAEERSMSVMQLPEKHDHQLSGGVSKERRRPMTMLSEDDVGWVDQWPDAGHQPSIPSTHSASRFNPVSVQITGYATTRSAPLSENSEYATESYVRRRGRWRRGCLADEVRSLDAEQRSYSRSNCHRRVTKIYRRSNIDHNHSIWQKNRSHLLHWKIKKENKTDKYLRNTEALSRG